MPNFSRLCLYSILILACFSTPAFADDLSLLAKEGSYSFAQRTAGGKCPLEIQYPVFGHPALDQSVSNWVNQYFERNARECANAVKDMPEKSLLWEEIGSGRVASATKGSVSIHFSFFSDGGGAHPNHPEYTLVLDEQGKTLKYTDIFETTEGLWKFLSDFCFTALQPKMKQAECWDASTVKGGLSPTPDSFTHFFVTPSGLRMVFPEYQIASYVCGRFECAIPLQALVRFTPKPAIWGTVPAPVKSTSTPSFKPSFDCAKAGNAVETAICNDASLAKLDVQMTAAYTKALASTSDKKTLKAAQRQWLQQMHSQCGGQGEATCISQHYQKRLRELQR